VYFVERQCGKSARALDFDACKCAHPTTTETRTYAQGVVSLIYLIAFSFRMLDLLIISLLLLVVVCICDELVRPGDFSWGFLLFTNLERAGMTCSPIWSFD
jgi:hypothetical protein